MERRESTNPEWNGWSVTSKLQNTGMFNKKQRSKNVQGSLSPSHKGMLDVVAHSSMGPQWFPKFEGLKTLRSVADACALSPELMKPFLVLGVPNYWWVLGKFDPNANSSIDCWKSSLRFLMLFVRPTIIVWTCLWRCIKGYFAHSSHDKYTVVTAYMRVPYIDYDMHIHIYI